MAPRRVHNVKSLEPHRRELRRSLTLAEGLLWKQLQHRRLAGRKFRRQHGIGRYIVDFLCPECRVIVELDGAPHFDVIREEYDSDRTRYLEGLGYRVLRFENRRVLEELEFVLEEIRRALRNDA